MSEETTEPKGEFLKQFKSLPRLMEITLALLFILAAYLKAVDPNLFVAQIYSYDVTHDPTQLRLIAIFATAIESALGVAMLFALRLGKLTHIATMLMLLFYTGLIAYAWQVNGLKDCGCFGDVKIPPQMGILKNIVMMTALAYAMRGKLQGWSLDFLIAKITLTLLVGIGTAYFISLELPQTPPNQTDQTDPTDPTDPPITTAPAPEARFANIKTRDPISGEELDLAKGEYIVAMLSMTCEHCMATIPTLNEIAFDMNLPPVVALCWEPEEGSFQDFTAQTSPQFAMIPLGNGFINFSKYIGGAPPRISYLRDGHELFFWDTEAPTLDAVYSKIEELRTTPITATPSEKPEN